MKLKFVSGLIQIASLRFIEALEGSKITVREIVMELGYPNPRFPVLLILQNRLRNKSTNFEFSVADLN